MKKPIIIRRFGNVAPGGNRGSITLCYGLGGRPPLSSGGFWGLYIFLVLLGVTVGSTPITAALPDPNQTDPSFLSPEAKLLDELRTVVQTLREERTEYYEKQRQLESHIQQKRNDMAALENKVTELLTSEEQVDRDLMKIEQDVKQLALELQTKKAHQAQLKKTMDDWIGQGRKAVDEGIPFRQQERCERLAPFEQENIESASVTAADQLGRIWSFFQEEMRMARSGEIFTQQIDIGNKRVKYAQLFRVGHQILGYLTEDGQETGLWLEPSGRKQWQQTLADDDAKAAQTAVEILDRRQEPKLISLPVSIRIDRKPEEHELDRENAAKE